MSIFEKAREVAIIQSSASVIGWDQETYLPPSAEKYRAEQLAWLTSRAHELATSDAWKKDLELAESSNLGDDPKLTANLREMRREFDRATKLSVDLIARDSMASSLAKYAWAEAREQSDFARFSPHLQTLLNIAREKADLWGYQDEPYDALLDGYERATSTAAVANLFDQLRPAVREIAARAVEKSASHPPSLPAGPYSIAAQQRFNAQVAEAIGFDFQAGRIDTTTHPFCTTLGPRDIRLTTRYDEADFTSSLFGVLHEAGHGLYEQGLPADDFGLPSGTAVSLGIHESQSRLWENHVGRSQIFWEKWYPTAQEHFPQLKGFSPEDFLHYLRRAEFSPIRVEADEATYDLHILLRFELERRMVDGRTGLLRDLYTRKYQFRPAIRGSEEGLIRGLSHGKSRLSPATRLVEEIRPFPRLDSRSGGFDPASDWLGTVHRGVSQPSEIPLSLRSWRTDFSSSSRESTARANPAKQNALASGLVHKAAKWL